MMGSWGSCLLELRRLCCPSSRPQDPVRVFGSRQRAQAERDRQHCALPLLLVLRSHTRNQRRVHKRVASRRIRRWRHRAEPSEFGDPAPSPDEGALCELGSSDDAFAPHWASSLTAHTHAQDPTRRRLRKKQREAAARIVRREREEKARAERAGRPCKWGVNCQRVGCWFAHPAMAGGGVT